MTPERDNFITACAICAICVIVFFTAGTISLLVDSSGLKAETATPTTPGTAIETVCEHFQRGNSGSEHWTTTDVCTARSVAAGYSGPR